MMRKFLVLPLCLVLILSGCASGPDRGDFDPTVDQNVSSSLRKEVEIGQQIHDQILSTFYIYSEPRIVNYINEIGMSLARHTERSHLPYKFTLLYDEKIYATSAPGGFVYLTTGMINFLENEAELAAVLAHELGQLQFKDPKLSGARKALNGVTQLGATVAPAFGSFGALAILGLVLVNMIADGTQVSPGNRLEKSDELAFNYLTEAGYDPQALLDFLNRLLEAPEDIVPYFYDYYQSRPITVDRMMNVQTEFSRLSLDGKTLSTQYKIFQDKTKGIQEMYKI